MTPTDDFPDDFVQQLRDAMWDGRWIALESFWNAALAHRWIFVVFGIALLLKGRRAWLAAGRWIGATVWHHTRD